MKMTKEEALAFLLGALRANQYSGLREGTIQALVKHVEDSIR